ncbi:MAG: OB-fold domain-containing protein [Deltaproteobacteria bacterium]|nr:OB-fold domain-containing protein [Deltaproteobacteria bacterium]
MSQTQNFQDGLFEIEGDSIRLIGSKCKSCGRVVYPAAKSCLDCCHEEVEPLKLSSTGKLYTYTTVHMPIPHFPPPFNLGSLELPEGLSVFASIAEGTELKVGLPVRLVPAVLWREGETDVVGYRIAAT